MRKLGFCIYENKDADQLCVTGKLISAFAFATRIVQYLYFLYTKFQASSHLVVVQSGLFSHNEAHLILCLGIYLYSSLTVY